MIKDKLIYKWFYKTPSDFDDIVLLSDGEFLTGLYFSCSEILSDFKCDFIEKEIDVFKETEKWLDTYFSGARPDFVPRFKIENGSLFRNNVLKIVSEIEFGKTITYGEIAEKLKSEMGVQKMSSQAVGGAVGSNPICIIIPCHRVVGKYKKLTGYSGGLNNKIALLKLEGNNIDKSRQ